MCISLTGIVSHAAARDAVLDAGQRGQAGHEPAVSQASLLDIAALDILHECGLFENLVNSLDRLGHHRLGAQQRSLGNFELFGSNVVEGVALFILEIPVLATVLAKKEIM